MTNETSRAGRKPVSKTWDTKFSHTLRTDFATDSDVHLLLFIAGDRASQLIHAALQAFAKANGIPIDDPAFQESVCLQAGTMIAKTKRSPNAVEVMQAIGKSAVLKKLIASLENGGKAGGPQAREIAPRALQAPMATNLPVMNTSLLSDTAKPIAAIEPQPVPSMAPSTQITPQPPNMEAPMAAPPTIEMGPEIEIDLEEVKPASAVQTLKNRWLTGHDY